VANSLTKKTPYKGPGADSEEKHEPASDIDTAPAVESLKVLDPKWPIREADSLDLPRVRPLTRPNQTPLTRSPAFPYAGRIVPKVSKPGFQEII